MTLFDDILSPHKHQSHRMHPHSVKAHREEGAKLSKRAAMILAYLRERGPQTDRQVCRGLGFGDMNCVRPRATELIDAGLAEECGKATDLVTGKTVRVVRAKPNV